MATNYPGILDVLTNPSPSDTQNSPSHSAQHTNANDAIEAIETVLGTDPAGASATVNARIAAVESVRVAPIVLTGSPSLIPAIAGWENTTSKPTGFPTGSLFAKWEDDGSGGRTLLGWSF